MSRAALVGKNGSKDALAQRRRNTSAEFDLEARAVAACPAERSLTSRRRRGVLPKF